MKTIPGASSRLPAHPSIHPLSTCILAPPRAGKRKVGACFVCVGDAVSKQPDMMLHGFYECRDVDEGWHRFFHKFALSESYAIRLFHSFISWRVYDIKSRHSRPVLSW